MYSRKMFQSSKQRVLKVTWERCCDLAWKASRRSLHRDHTSVLARDVQGAKATPNRAKRAPGCTSEKKMTSSIAREFPMFRNISERVEDVRVHKREKIRVHKREKIRVHKRPPCLMCSQFCFRRGVRRIARFRFFGWLVKGRRKPLQEWSTLSWCDWQPWWIHGNIWWATGHNLI